MLRRTLWKMKVKWPNLGRWMLVGCGLMVGGLVGWWLTLKDWQREELVFSARWQIALVTQSPSTENRPYRNFKSCNEARLAGYGSMRADEPSYRSELDYDGDGVACEPWCGGRGWRWRLP